MEWVAYNDCMKPEKRHFIRIGSRPKYFSQLGVIAPIGLLNHAHRSKLPVLDSIILLEAVWQRLQKDEVITVKDGSVIVHDSAYLLAQIGLQAPPKMLAIAPAYGADGEYANWEQFVSYKQVNSAEKTTLITTIVDLWNDRPTDLRGDVFLFEYPPSTQQIGTARTDASTEEDDEIMFNGQTTSAPKLGRFGKNLAESEEIQRVQRLLDGVRRSFNREETTKWEIHWLDDGKSCWLTHIRAI